MMEKELAADKKFNLAFQMNLLQLMREHNIKQAQLAKALDLHPSTLSKYLNQEGKGPSAYWAALIAQYFNVSLQWMGGLTEERLLLREPDIPAEYFSLSPQGKELVDEYIVQHYNWEQKNASVSQAAEGSRSYRADARQVRNARKSSHRKSTQE